MFTFHRPIYEVITRNVIWESEIFLDYVIARESITKHLTRHFSQTAAGCWHFLILAQKSKYCCGIARSASVAPFTRSGRASSTHTRINTHSFYKRLHLHVELVAVVVGISLSPRLLPSARASASTEKRMSVARREGAIDSKRAHVQTAHYLPARTKIIDKRISACIEMQKKR